MIGGISDSNKQFDLKSNHFYDLRDQIRLVEESNRTDEKRKIEKSNNSMQSDLKFQHEDTTTQKNVLRDGQLLVESYDKNGKLVRITPPGYIPFNHSGIKMLI